MNRLTIASTTLLLTIASAPALAAGPASLAWSACDVEQGVFLVPMSQARGRVPPPLVPIAIGAPGTDGAAAARLSIGILRCVNADGTPLSLAAVSIGIEAVGPATSVPTTYEHPIFLAISPPEAAATISDWIGAPVGGVYLTTTGAAATLGIGDSTATTPSGSLTLTHAFGPIDPVPPQPTPEIYRFMNVADDGLLRGFDFNIEPHFLGGGPGNFTVDANSGPLARIPEAIGGAGVVGHAGSSAWDIEVTPVGPSAPPAQQLRVGGVGQYDPYDDNDGWTSSGFPIHEFLDAQVTSVTVEIDSTSTATFSYGDVVQVVDFQNECTGIIAGTVYCRHAYSNHHYFEATLTAVGGGAFKVSIDRFWYDDGGEFVFGLLMSSP